MTRAEIIALAAVELRDTSESFKRVLDQLFTTCLLELAQAEAIGAVRQTAVFEVRADLSDYETREITQVTPHRPQRILDLTVYAWGPTGGVIRRATSPDQFRQHRLASGEGARGRWELWQVSADKRLLQVWPPAAAADDGALCEVTCERPPHLVAPDQDLVELAAEDVPAIVAGLRAHGAAFSEDTASQQQTYLAAWQAGIRTVWGRRWNSQPVRTRPKRF